MNHLSIKDLDSFNLSTIFSTESEIQPLIDELESRDLESVTHLNISNNVFYPNAMRKFSETLKKFKNLKILEAERIFSAMPKNEMTKSLNILSASILGLSDDIIEVIYKFDGFEDVDGRVFEDKLEFYGLKDDDEILIEQLENYKAKSFLEIVDFSENAISWCLPVFLRILLVKSGKLLDVIMRDCGLGVGGMKNLMETLSEKNSEKNSEKKSEDSKNLIKKINLSRNKITKNIIDLANSLENLPNLEDLNLSYNTTFKEEVQILVEEIFSKNSNKNLKNLDLRDCFVSEESAYLLGKLFVRNSMENLIIGDCLLKDEGLKSFIKGFEEENTDKKHGSEDIMTVLDLSYNDLTDDSQKIILETFKDYKNLKLIIFGNEFEDEDLLESLEKKILDNGGSVVLEEEDDVLEFEKSMLEKKFENLALGE